MNSNISIKIFQEARSLAKKNKITRIMLNHIAKLLIKNKFGRNFVKSVIEPWRIDRKSYLKWIEKYFTVTDTDRARILNNINKFPEHPFFSIIIPVYKPNIEFLKIAIESVKIQLYGKWEICLIDDGSNDKQVTEILREISFKDSRVKVILSTENQNISAASNRAASIAVGTHLAFMDQDDAIEETALYHFAKEINSYPQSNILYSDEDKIDEKGIRFDPYFKTIWDDELILTHNMVNHMCVIRREFFNDLGGFRIGFEGAQDYDLLLRARSRTDIRNIRHIPNILYHWRHVSNGHSFSQVCDNLCLTNAQRACSEYLTANNLGPAEVVQSTINPGWLTVIRNIPNPEQRVSIIIPTRDRAEILKSCVFSIINNTNYRNYEIIIADNESVEHETITLLDDLKSNFRISVLNAPGPFNYSKINNDATKIATGDILLFLNNDIIIKDSKWLDQLVSQLTVPNTGIVGAKLVYPDGRIQHAGILLGVGSPHQIAKNAYSGAPKGYGGYQNFLNTTRSVSAVTGACLAIGKQLFLEVGGFDSDLLKIAFNDVDLCLRVRERGLNVVWNPTVCLTHLESASRGPETGPEKFARFASEANVMRSRWGYLLDRDPFYGPNFDRITGDYRLANPPKNLDH